MGSLKQFEGLVEALIKSDVRPFEK